MRTRLPTNLSGRIPELDGLRGMAIALIVLLHYFLETATVQPGSLWAYVLACGRLAWTGVDLFFVLSGFLIGGILIDSRDSGNYFEVFYTRRFFRIVPIYFVYLGLYWLLIILASKAGLAAASVSPSSELPWAPHFLFLQNFWMAARNTLGQLSVTWSLAVEEQFYLFAPLLIRVISPKRLVPALLAGIAAAPTLRVAIHALWPSATVSWLVLMPCRADALLLGVLGAVVLRDPEWRARLEQSRSWLRAVLAVLGFGVAVLTWRYSNPSGVVMSTVGFTWLALFYLCVLLYVLSNNRGKLSGCLRWAWLRRLGGIAYGTYLFHSLAFSLLWGFVLVRKPAINTLGEFLAVVATLAVTLLVCQISWSCFEKQLIKIGHRMDYEMTTRRSVAIPVTAENVRVSSL